MFRRKECPSNVAVTVASKFVMTAGSSPLLPRAGTAFLPLSNLRFSPRAPLALCAGDAYNCAIDLRHQQLPARGEAGMLRLGRPIRRAWSTGANPMRAGDFLVAVERT
jgi:hypothetical protein